MLHDDPIRLLAYLVTQGHEIVVKEALLNVIEFVLSDEPDEDKRPLLTGEDILEVIAQTITSGHHHVGQENPDPHRIRSYEDDDSGSQYPDDDNAAEHAESIQHRGLPPISEEEIARIAEMLNNSPSGQRNNPENEEDTKHD